MSPERNEPPAPVLPPRDAETASEVTEFFDRELNDYREEALRRRRRFFRRRTKLSVGLFLATCVTTFLAGMLPGNLGGALDSVWILVGLAGRLTAGGLWPPLASELMWNGLVFATCLMAILFAHEMGHFLLALRHRVPATLPFFIPLPIGPFGTLGAVIIQDAGRANRRQLFDIAIAGPLAGLVLALPIAWYGVSQSELIAGGGGEYSYGDPLLLRWIVAAVHGEYGPNQDIRINAPLFAGWVGIFITALNLLPVGQFDGGHLLYTLIGRKAHYVAYAVLGSAVAWMAYTRELHFALMVVLLFLFGPKHPPTADDAAPLGPLRVVLGWCALAFVVVGFTPSPIIVLG